MPQEMIAIYDTLTEENKRSLLSYASFLIQEQQKLSKAERSKQLLLEINDLLSKENPWNSEEEMLAELAEDRRQRQGLVK